MLPLSLLRHRRRLPIPLSDAAIFRHAMLMRRMLFTRYECR